jgi:prepilin-type N-terminal cleavage/methylation domain-containing protein
MKKAFSLIELSIVILIIGIIIAGVTQSSVLLAKVKIQSAQILTKNSPVAGINGLSLWLEPTLSESFVSGQTEEGQVIAQWNDINPQTANKLYMVNSFNPNFVSPNQVYSENGGPGGLPSIYFDNTQNGQLGLVVTPTDTDEVALISDKQTFFMVYETTPSSFLAQTNNWSFQLTDAYYFYNTRYMDGNVRGGVVSSNAEIASFTVDSKFNLYVNGSNVISSTRGGGDLSTYGRFGINGGYFYVSEMIVYDHALKDEERQSVEQYLGKKYGVKVVVTATPTS